MRGHEMQFISPKSYRRHYRTGTLLGHEPFLTAHLKDSMSKFGHLTTVQSPLSYIFATKKKLRRGKSRGKFCRKS